MDAYSQGFQFGVILLESVIVINLAYDNDVDIVKIHFLTSSLKWQQGAFQKVYELVKLGAFKSSLFNKLHIFQCVSNMFCVEF